MKIIRSIFCKIFGHTWSSLYHTEVTKTVLVGKHKNKKVSYKVNIYYCDNCGKNSNDVRKKEQRDFEKSERFIYR